MTATAPDAPRVVRVLPDEPAIAKSFDYLVPGGVGDQVRVGDRVRIALAGRRVGGWITAVDVEPPAGVALRPLAKLSGRGPTPDLLELAEWAAWRWAGRPASFLRTASPERNVHSLPAVPPRHAAAPGTGARSVPEAGAAARPPVSGAGVAGRPPVSERALDAGRAVVRLPPATDPSPIALAAAARGNALVLCPTAPLARHVAGRLRAVGVTVAEHPGDWALGVAGATVVGTRAAAWAPVGELAAVVVIDEHDESHQQEQAPTWHARDVAAERARRAGVPCVLTSPCPSLEALAWGTLLTPDRAVERHGWPVVDIVDMHREDPRTGLLPERLVRVLRSDRRVLCVLNRTGRARLLACAACRELVRCERCDANVTQPADELACTRCGATRPVVCLHCGGTKLRALRQGVTRVRDEIAALVGEPVDEVTGARPAGEAPRTRVVVGTEATLHQIPRADVVAFLDIDQELLAPRYRAAEEALGLVARAARLVGGRAGGGRLLIQTHVPAHEVVQAALHGDPSRVSDAEAERRELLRFPPVTAMAEISGAAAPDFVAALTARSPDALLPPPPPAPSSPASLSSPAWADVIPGHPAAAPAPPSEPAQQPGGGPEVPLGGLWDGPPPPPPPAPSTDRGPAAGPPSGRPEPAGDGGPPGDVEVIGPADGRWLVRAADHRALCDALAAVPRPAGRLRVAVDPPRI